MPKRFLMIPEQVFNLGPDAGLDLFDALLQSSIRRIRQGLALARTHGDFPLNLAPWFSPPLLSALVAGITHAKPFFSMQQGMGLVTSLTLAGGGDQCMHHTVSASTPMCAFMPKCH